MGMQFHFVGRRPDARIAQHQFHFRNCHVRSADVPHQARVHQRLHLPPGAHVVFVDVRLGVRIARAHVASRRVVVRKRPVHQVKIEILEAQIFERLLARSAQVIVLVVPHLRRDPKLLALVARAKQLCKSRADAFLVAINRRAVKVPVADGGRVAHSIGHRFMRNAIRSEGPQANGRHARAACQNPLRHCRRIDSFLILPNVVCHGIVSMPNCKRFRTAPHSELVYRPAAC